MTSEGFSAVRQRSEQVAAVLREIGALIGAADGTASDAPSAGLGMLSEAAAITRRARDTEQGIFKLLVLGRFKNGKSTLLNAMLGDRVLPASAVPATAIITMLVHGESPDVEVYRTSSEEPLTYSAAEFREQFKLTLEDQETLRRNRVVDRFRDIEYAQIECQHPFCANGVRLVDAPGLGEAVSRARVATNFLQQAHAVIFVLDATAILGQEEKQFVEAHLAPLADAAQNVFFVVNRIDLVDERDAEELRTWVFTTLKPRFATAEGDVDLDLGRRRVFFLSARDALEARLERPVNLIALEASGLPALEREIEHFLTGEERVRAELGAPFQAALQVVAEACHRITRAKVALDAPLQELERRRIETEQRLEVLSQDRRRVEQTVLRFGEIVGRRVYNDLVKYVEEMRSAWPQEAGLAGGGERLLHLDDVSNEDLMKVVASSTRDSVRKHIMDVIQGQVDEYLRLKFEQWGERVPAVIQPDIDLMVEEVRRQVEDFAIELDRIDELFAAGEVSSDAGRILGELGRDHGVRTALSLMTLMLEDLGRSTGAFGSGEWGSFVRWLIGHAVVGWAVVIVFGMFALPFFLAAEFFLIQRPTDKLKQIILAKTGEQIHADLQKAIAARREEIRARTDAQFQQIAGSVTKVLQTQIDEMRLEQDRIIRQKQDQRFSIEQEKRRLDAIQERLLELLDRISIAARGQGLDGPERDAITSGRASDMLMPPVQAGSGVL